MSGPCSSPLRPLQGVAAAIVVAATRCKVKGVVLLGLISLLGQPWSDLGGILHTQFTVVVGCC